MVDITLVLLASSHACVRVINACLMQRAKWKASKLGIMLAQETKQLASSCSPISFTAVHRIWSNLFSRAHGACAKEDQHKSEIRSNSTRRICNP